MALRKVKGERRDGFVNMRMPEDVMQSINILAFLENESGVDVVIRAVRELAQKESHRIQIMRDAIDAANQSTEVTNG